MYGKKFATPIAFISVCGCTRLCFMPVAFRVDTLQLSLAGMCASIQAVRWVMGQSREAEPRAAACKVSLMNGAWGHEFNSTGAQACLGTPWMVCRTTGGAAAWGMLIVSYPWAGRAVRRTGIPLGPCCNAAFVALHVCLSPPSLRHRCMGLGLCCGRGNPHQRNADLTHGPGQGEYEGSHWARSMLNSGLRIIFMCVTICSPECPLCCWLSLRVLTMLTRMGLHSRPPALLFLKPLAP